MNLLPRSSRFVLELLAMLLLGVSPLAQAAFSNASLSGNFAFTAFHFNSTTSTQPLAQANGTPMLAPHNFVAAEGVTTFDGNGNFTRTFTKNVNGIISINQTDGGTYAVSPSGVYTATFTTGCSPNCITTTAYLNQAATMLVTSSPAPGSDNDPRFAVSGKIVGSGSYGPAILNGLTANFAGYGYDLVAVQQPVTVGAPMPTPKGFQSFAGSVNFSFDGVNATYTMNLNINEDGAPIQQNGKTGTYTVAADGTITMTSNSNKTLSGHIVNGNTLVLASTTAGDNPLIAIGSLQLGTYSNASLKGRYNLIDRNYNAGTTQVIAPQPGSGVRQPAPLGFDVNIGTFIADGNGNWSVQLNSNTDGVPGTQTHSGTYSVAADGSLTINTGEPTPKTGRVQNGGDNWYFTAPANATPSLTKDPEFVYAVKGPQSATRYDLDGDGKADLLWRNSSTGDTYAWLMNALTPPGGGFLPTVADTNWKVRAIADLDGDGNADVVWTNTSTGENYVWLMNGMTIKGGDFLPTVSTAWTIQDAADLDGDGYADIVWRNDSTGENYVWLMNGLTIKGGDYLPTIAAPWSIQALADLDGDGRADIVWRNTSTGENYVWFMNGMTITNGGYLPAVSTAWTIKGVADLNGDTMADIFWRNETTGDDYVWMMNGLTIANGAYLPTVDPAWQCGVADIDGDGLADIVWRNATTGEDYAWLMNGMTITAGGYLPTVADMNWQVAGIGGNGGGGTAQIPLLLNLTTNWPVTAGGGPCTNSYSVSLVVKDGGGNIVGNVTKQESSACSASVQITTDNLSASYPAGQGATYSVSAGVGTGTNNCAVSNGTGAVVDANANNPSAYPTVTVTCN